MERSPFIKRQYLPSFLPAAGLPHPAPSMQEKPLPNMVSLMDLEWPFFGYSSVSPSTLEALIPFLKRTGPLSFFFCLILTSQGILWNDER
jgi:hypothetical protein